MPIKGPRIRVRLSDQMLLLLDFLHHTAYPVSHRLNPRQASPHDRSRPHHQQRPDRHRHQYFHKTHPALGTCRCSHDLLTNTTVSS